MKMDISSQRGSLLIEVMGVIILAVMTLPYFVKLMELILFSFISVSVIECIETQIRQYQTEHQLPREQFMPWINQICRNHGPLLPLMQNMFRIQMRFHKKNGTETKMVKRSELVFTAKLFLFTGNFRQLKHTIIMLN